MIRSIADGVHTHEASITLGPGVRLPARATLLRLRDGGLMLHSPVAVADEDARAISALGEVKMIVAPSLYHWLFVEGATRRWPGARVLAVPGLAKKMPGMKLDPLPASGAIDPDVVVERVAGAPKLDEHVFHHVPSRSLVVTDLLFNINEGSNFVGSLVLRAMGAWRKPAQSRMWRFVVDDRAQAAESATRILASDFERTIMAHGDILEGDAAARTRAALAWMINAA
jgi:hypothetical protein